MGRNGDPLLRPAAGISLTNAPCALRALRSRAASYPFLCLLLTSRLGSARCGPPLWAGAVSLLVARPRCAVLAADMKVCFGAASCDLAQSSVMHALGAHVAAAGSPFVFSDHVCNASCAVPYYELYKL